MAVLKTVGVVGCGLMGSGIAQVAAQAGFTTMGARGRQGDARPGPGTDQEVPGRRGREGEGDRGGPRQGSGQHQGHHRSRRSRRVRPGRGGGGREHRGEARGLLRRWTNPRGLDAVLASNTSSLSITEIAATATRPERVLGLHFFNPVPLMKLVEIIRALPTNDAAFEIAKGFVEKIGKTAVVAKDTPGFVVNRLLVPLPARRRSDLRVGGRIAKKISTTG